MHCCVSREVIADAFIYGVRVCASCARHEVRGPPALMHSLVQHPVITVCEAPVFSLADPFLCPLAARLTPRAAPVVQDLREGMKVCSNSTWTHTVHACLQRMVACGRSAAVLLCELSLCGSCASPRALTPMPLTLCARALRVRLPGVQIRCLAAGRHRSARLVVDLVGSTRRSAEIY